MNPETVKKLNAHLEGNRVPRPHIQCADGSSISVQAGSFVWSRFMNNKCTHAEVETHTPVEQWKEFDAGSDSMKVYAYVPFEAIVQEIDRRGGFAEK